MSSLRGCAGNEGIYAVTSLFVMLRNWIENLRVVDRETSPCHMLYKNLLRSMCVHIAYTHLVSHILGSMFLDVLEWYSGSCSPEFC